MTIAQGDHPVKTLRWLSLPALLLALLVAGCNKESQSSKGPEQKGTTALSAEEAKIQGALAELTTPEDRRLAEAQKFCAVRNNNRLGSMGKPHKVMLDGQPVFLCCDGCEDTAKADPKKTLAKVEQLKKANAK
jgi:nitrous oxide reductase accessory protein NosL